ncbi:MAG TPA: cysteine synthase A [Candidatus Ventricola intestinavium]|nr:cysteine synthase A [Candidatus Ventricola intestinavium]
MMGGTPLLELTRLEKKDALQARILAKLECMNPAGSSKDRVARSILNDAQRCGKIGPGSVIVEPTSGNTGIGLCAVAAARGYRVIIVMPETMSRERQQIMRAFGAQVVLTEGKAGMQGAIDRAEALVKEIPGAFLAGQFTNPANPEAHYAGTGPEIERDTGGQIDFLVAGVGTGGTITGAGRYLKERHPQMKVVAVEPASSPVLSGGKAGPHGLQGIGAGFVPQVLDPGVYDEVIAVREEEAYAMGRRMAREEGVLVGISSGAALHAAMAVAARRENRGKTIVVILPDSGERYLSTPMFDD